MWFSPRAGIASKKSLVLPRDLQLICRITYLQSWTKVLGKFPLYPLPPPPPPPITMLIFSGGENADESIDGSNISTLSGGGGGGGSKKCTKRTRCVSVIRVEVRVVKCSSIRPSLLSVPTSYDQDCR